MHNQTISDVFDDPGDVIHSLKEKARSTWERDFASDLEDKFDDWGDSTFLTDRQADVINQILEDRS